MRALILILASLPIHASVINGLISNWQESGPSMAIGDGTNNINTWWSCGFCTNNGTAYFYGNNFSTASGSEVALAAGITDISQLSNAAGYTYTTNSVGQVSTGEFVLYHSITNNHYAAVRVDQITSPGVMNATWWFQTTAGNADLRPSAVPEPATLLLVGVGLLATGALRRSVTRR